MKKAFLLFISISFSVSMYSQTNRYSTVTTSTYTPSTSSVDYSYYEAMAKRKAEYVYEKSTSLQSKVNDYVNSTNDPLFRNDLYEVKSYLNPIFNNKRISISSAEWYLKKARKKFNRAIRKYNKRLKKKN